MLNLEIYKLLGDRLTANEMDKLLKIINKPRCIEFSNDIRLEIQRESEKVFRGEISGSQFGVFLNVRIAPKIPILYKA